MEKREAWRLIYLLLLGQFVSFLLAVNSFISSLLANLGVNAPLSQTFLTYSSLLLVYGTIFLYQRQKLIVSWYWYLLLAIVDVQGNFFVVKAYQYAPITSVTLLDCWTIPWVIILTWFVIGTRYSLPQFLGAAICIVGLLLVLLSDSSSSSSQEGKKTLLGDVLVIAGTLCYASSNVGEEYLVKRKNIVELLLMLGVFGVIVGACEISVFERKHLEAIEWSPTIIGLAACLSASTFLFYTVVPFVLKMSGSTLFNLSLLTSDVWAVLIRIFFYNQQVDWLYYLAFVFVATGLIIYSMNEKESATPTNIMEEDQTIQYERVAQEDSTTQTQPSHLLCEEKREPSQV